MRVFAVAAAFAALTVPAVADDVYGQPTLPDSSAVWDGMLHMKVGCSPGGPSCNADVTVYDPSDQAHSIEGAEIKVDAGATKSLLIDPGPTASKKLGALKSIFIRVRPLLSDGREPQPQPQPLEKTLKLVHESVDNSPGPGGKPIRLGPRTKLQVLKDKRGDSHDKFTHMDIVGASARRKGRVVVFTVTTANRPPNIHDGFGNPAAPCLEIPFNLTGNPRRPYPMQTCGDARLRGYKQHYWPKVRFSISGRTSTWKIPLKLLPKKAFRWRAYIADGWNTADVAPNKGYKKFIR